MIYRESSRDDPAIEEEVSDLRSKEKPIIIGDVEADEDEKDVLTMNRKKPIQLEPKLSDFQVDMEICFCSVLNSEKYNTSHLEGIPWEELEELDKQKFIEREAKMRREHKCIRMNNLRVIDSRFNTPITLPKALSQEKEVYINPRPKTFIKKDADISQEI